MHGAAVSAVPVLGNLPVSDSDLGHTCQGVHPISRVLLSVNHMKRGSTKQLDPGRLALYCLNWGLHLELPHAERRASHETRLDSKEVRDVFKVEKVSLPASTGLIRLLADGKWCGSGCGNGCGRGCGLECYN